MAEPGMLSNLVNSPPSFDISSSAASRGESASGDINSLFSTGQLNVGGTKTANTTMLLIAGVAAIFLLRDYIFKGKKRK